MAILSTKKLYEKNLFDDLLTFSLNKSILIVSPRASKKEVGR